MRRLNNEPSCPLHLAVGRRQGQVLGVGGECWGGALWPLCGCCRALCYGNLPCHYQLKTKGRPLSCYVIQGMWVYTSPRKAHKIYSTLVNIILCCDRSTFPNSLTWILRHDSFTCERLYGAKMKAGAGEKLTGCSQCAVVFAWLILLVQASYITHWSRSSTRTMWQAEAPLRSLTRLHILSAHQLCSLWLVFKHITWPGRAAKR